MADVEKQTEDPNFKPGVMSPKSKQTFADIRKRNFQPIGKHKLVLDENIFENRFLRCHICKQLYNDTDRSPRILPCHHCFCLACVMDFYWKDHEERQRLTPAEVKDIVYVVTVTCPICSNSFVSTLEGLQELVADHRIIQLLDFVGTTDKHSVEYCPKHQSQPLNFFCEKCAIRICRDCIVIDHKQCSNDKLVLDYHAALQKYEPVLTNGVKEMEEEVKSLNEKKGEVITAKENYRRADEDIITSIKESFERLRASLAERENQLIELAKKEVNVKEFDFEDKTKAFEDKESEAKDLGDLVTKSAKSSDIRDKYKAYNLLKKYKTEPSLQKEEYEHKNDKIVTYNCRDEVVLTTKISKYGDIETKSNSLSSGGSYGRSSSVENSSGSGSSTLGTGSSYLSSSSSLGSYSSGSGRTYGSYLGGSSLYSGSSYSSSSRSSTND